MARTAWEDAEEAYTDSGTIHEDSVTMLRALQCTMSSWNFRPGGWRHVVRHFETPAAAADGGGMETVAKETAADGGDMETATALAPEGQTAAMETAAAAGSADSNSDTRTATPT